MTDLDPRSPFPFSTLIQQFETVLDEPVNGGWTITLVTDKAITMTLNLEADLLSQSPDQKTSVFGPRTWNGVTVNPNLAKGKLVSVCGLVCGVCVVWMRYCLWGLD